MRHWFWRGLGGRFLRLPRLGRWYGLHWNLGRRRQFVQLDAHVEGTFPAVVAAIAPHAIDRALRSVPGHWNAREGVVQLRSRLADGGRHALLAGTVPQDHLQAGQTETRICLPNITEKRGPGRLGNAGENVVDGIEKRVEDCAWALFGGIVQRRQFDRDAAERLDQVVIIAGIEIQCALLFCQCQQHGIGGNEELGPFEGIGGQAGHGRQPAFVVFGLLLGSRSLDQWNGFEPAQSGDEFMLHRPTHRPLFIRQRLRKARQPSHRGVVRLPAQQGRDQSGIVADGGRCEQLDCRSFGMRQHHSPGGEVRCQPVNSFGLALDKPCRKIDPVREEDLGQPGAALMPVPLVVEGHVQPLRIPGQQRAGAGLKGFQCFFKLVRLGDNVFDFPRLDHLCQVRRGAPFSAPVLGVVVIIMTAGVLGFPPDVVADLDGVRIRTRRKPHEHEIAVRGGAGDKVARRIRIGGEGVGGGIFGAGPDEAADIDGRCEQRQHQHIADHLSHGVFLCPTERVFLTGGYIKELERLQFPSCAMGRTLPLTPAAGLT